MALNRRRCGQNILITVFFLYKVLIIPFHQHQTTNGNPSLLANGFSLPPRDRKISSSTSSFKTMSYHFISPIEVRGIVNDTYARQGETCSCYSTEPSHTLPLTSTDLSTPFANGRRGLQVVTSCSYSSSSLNPLETWCITHINVLYSKSLSIKCPFFRRRTTDFLDALDMVMRFLLIRHKSLPIIGPPPGCRSLTGTKRTGLAIPQLMEIIRYDWKPHNHKGYYITGRLNTTIYRDDCLFQGPDPDMPVKGLTKYLNAASQLFDTATSTAELLSLQEGDTPMQNIFTNNSTTRNVQLRNNPHATIVASWRLQGVLHLPWHPTLPTWTGKTVYHLDENNLIYRHEEFWDISVIQAFTQTLLPQIGYRIWDASIRREIDT